MTDKTSMVRGSKFLQMMMELLNKLWISLSPKFAEEPGDTVTRIPPYLTAIMSLATQNMARSYG